MTAQPQYEWPELVPLQETPEPPPFPNEALPLWLRNFVHAHSWATQAPIDMAGMLALSAVSAAMQGKYNAVYGEWVETVNLYTATVMHPAERKSAIFNGIANPLREWETEIQASEALDLIKNQQYIMELDRAIESANTRVSKLRNAYDEARANTEFGPDAARKAEADLISARDIMASVMLEREQAEIMHKTKLLGNDLTPEACIQLLSRNPFHSMALMDDEGGIFEVLSGSRYSDSKNLDVFLKAHTGGEIIVNRVNREEERVRRAILSIGAAVQPGVIEDIGNDRQMRNRGLLARFLYAVPTSMVGRREINPDAVTPVIRTDYATGIKNIANASYRLDHIRDLPLDPDAAATLDEWRAALEPDLHVEDGRLSELSQWAGKSAGSIMRLSAIISAARAQGAPESITLSDMQSALQFAPYLEKHARKAFVIMGMINDHISESVIVAAIKRHRWDRFTARDLHDASHALHAQDNQHIEEALEALEVRGYVRHTLIGGSRSMKRVWQPNPALFDQSDKSD